VKIFVVGSKRCYRRVGEVASELERLGHTVTLPNNFDDPAREDGVKASGAAAYTEWKAGMLRLQAEKVAANDAVVVVNADKDGVPNYLGGATFLEVFKAWELGKAIYFLNPLPDGMLRDELLAMSPVVIEGDLSLVGS
jgi:hypothetical protein